MVCNHCIYRYSWDCDNGSEYPKEGCDSFTPDYETLTEKQKKAMRRILAHEEEIVHED